MIMKLKYIGTLLTSIALVVAAAAVSAQQAAPPREDTKAELPDRPAYPKKVEQSADAGLAAQAPDQLSDSDLIGSVQSVYGRNIPFFSGGGGEQNELSKTESALARKADELKRMLERAKGDSRRNEVRTKLAENLGQQFDLRQKRHGLEIEALERQVAKLKELVRKRQESRDDIISRRVEEIQRELDGLGW
jgi:hypothetical protein